MILQKILCIIIGYVFGLFQTGFLIGKAHNIDIREHGSGNSGTTNMMRTMGKKFGFLTFFGDAFKAIFAIALTYFLFNKSCSGHAFSMALYTGLGVILGHNFPFYMHFKGGKGIATTSGVILALLVYDWKFTVMGLCVFFITLYITKYVSFSSLCLMTAFFLEMVILGQLNMVHSLNDYEKPEVYTLVGIMVILSFIMHRENIKRLANGTERKIGEKKEA